MKLLTGRTETWKSSFVVWMSGIRAIYDHTEDTGNQKGEQQLYFPIFSPLRKPLWLKSASLHVKPSKTEGMIIALGKNLKTKSPFYHSRRDESFVLGPGSHCYGSRMEGLHTKGLPIKSPFLMSIGLTS